MDLLSSTRRLANWATFSIRKIHSFQIAHFSVIQKIFFLLICGTDCAVENGTYRSLRRRSLSEVAHLAPTHKDGQCVRGVDCKCLRFRHRQHFLLNRNDRRTLRQTEGGKQDPFLLYIFNCSSSSGFRANFLVEALAASRLPNENCDGEREGGHGSRRDGGESGAADVPIDGKYSLA